MAFMAHSSVIYKTVTLTI